MNKQNRPAHPFKRSALAIALSVAAGAAVAGDTAKENYQEAKAEAKAEYQEAKHEAKDAYRDAKAETRDAAEYTESAARNAWMHGKLETALLLNRHLNNFTIDTKVEGGKATLKGTVESDIDRELAENVALSIDGIDSINNELKVDAEKVKSDREARDEASGYSFAQRIEDATLTAAVKSKLIGSEASAMSINVDTRKGVVTLKGDVDSAEERALAAQVARNTDDVESVNNELTVNSES